VAEFIVARNPDVESTLPYLVCLPIDRGLWLKTKETWPRAARLYCHPADPPAIDNLEILERALVVACTRRGPAIDLVLARGTNKRSQFIFTVYRGKPVIFWQSPLSATSTRPGLRVPFAKAAASEIVLIDTRERYGYTFKAHGATTKRKALRAGDYAVEADERIVASIERKTLDNFATSLNDGSLNYAMAELAALPAAAVVVEGNYSALLRHAYSRAGYMADLVARLQVRYPSVPIVFLESRKIAEEWTFRFLRAARNHDAAPVLLSAAPPKAPKPRRTRRRPAVPPIAER